MAYVMLAIGTLMAVAGAYAAITGYSIIQVEQGWASVIAGASLTAGGIITIAIALVLRVLQSLQQVLTAQREQIVAADHVDIPAFVMPTSAAISEPAVLPDEGTKDLSIAKPETDRDTLFGAPPTSDDYKLETPSTPEHDLAPPPPPPPPPRPARTPPKSVPADDWLDRAFAEFDQDVTEPAGTPRPAPVETHAPEPEPAPKPETAVKAASPPPPAEPVAEDADSAVIGRYEADGTSYVMYADGSIEAQTYSGVYRFASMAELKAFIES